MAENTENAAPAKDPVQMAYDAGFRLLDVQWPEKLEEDDTRDLNKLATPGIHHNPFDARDPEQLEEYKAWLRGLKDRLERPTQSPEEILGDIGKALDE